MFENEKIDYRDGDVTLEGYCAYDKSITDKRPAVLVVHDWSGKNDFACQKAERLAGLGYIGFAVDMYGKGIIGNTKEEKMALMDPLMSNRELIQQRMNAALTAVKLIPGVDADNIGVIGFCFGGLCALDLARSGADIKGVVSFHGLLHSPDNAIQRSIKARVLALHGFDDPMVTPEHVMAFGDEMTEAKVDWQLDIYGNTMHAFTNPLANDSDFGTVYNKRADARSWEAMKMFFREIFGV